MSTALPMLECQYRVSALSGMYDSRSRKPQCVLWTLWWLGRVDRNIRHNKKLDQDALNKGTVHLSRVSKRRSLNPSRSVHLRPLCFALGSRRAASATWDLLPLPPRLDWLRTNGVNTNGAAAKTNIFDRLGKKVHPGTFGNIKVG